MKVDFPIGRLTLRELARAATAPHEGSPVSVPLSYSWAERGAVDNGVNVPAGFDTPYVTGWGQCFPYYNLGSFGKVHVRSISTYAKRLGTWDRIAQSDPIGGIYSASFIPNTSTPVDNDEAGVLSAGPVPGTALHFFTSTRAQMLSGTTAIAVVFQAKADADESWLIGAGADYWHNTTELSGNASLGQGQLCFVTSGWEWYGALWGA